MDRYLYQHYKGKYRVLPVLDEDTNDFPRDDEGNIDDAYADFYIKGRGGTKVIHGVGSELGLYAPKAGVGYNIIRDYCKNMLGKEYKSYEKAGEELIKAGYINNIDYLDGELLFTFDAKYIDDIHKVVKLKTSGANISPLSSKNLPTTPYTIPKAEMDVYKKAKEGLPPISLGHLNTEFGKKIWGKDYSKILRASHLKAMNFFHKEGRFDEYCKFLSEVKR